jgi:hypothetical protein
LLLGLIAGMVISVEPSLDGTGVVRATFNPIVIHLVGNIAAGALLPNTLQSSK